MSSIYEDWLEAKARLEDAKQEELMIRNAICQVQLQEIDEGSVTAHPTGYKVTATARLNRSIDREVLDSIWEDLTDKEREAIEYKPSLVLSAYRNLEEEGSPLTEAVTVKPGQSSLKVVPELNDEIDIY